MMDQNGGYGAKQVDWNPSGNEQGSPTPFSGYSQPGSQPQWPGNYPSQYAGASSNPPPPQQQQRQHEGDGGGYPGAAVQANAAARYGDSVDVPVNLTATKYRHRPWHYSLCVCCKEMDSCTEACCCLYCQLSRQCNMFVSNKRAIHWPYCLLMTLTDLCTAHLLVSWIFTSQTRRLSRERYGISGSCCNDCCVGCWCRTCSTQQVLLEMTVMNDFPGATCYDAVPQPMNFEMV